MSLLKKRGQVSKGDLRGALEKTGVGGAIGKHERIGLGKELSKKYGSQISRGNIRESISGLKRQRSKTRDSRARLELDRKIRLLEKI